MKHSKLAVLVLFCALFSTRVGVVHAEQASDSGRTNQEIKKRIDRVIEEKKQEVAGALAEISSKKRAFVGPIERVSENSLTITTHKGPLVVPLNESVKVLKNGKPAKVTDLAIGGWVLALGIETDGMFEPKFILTSDKETKPKERVVLLGTLTNIEKTTITLLTRGEKETKEITLTKKTNYQDADSTEIAATDFEEDLTVLVIATQDEDGLTASTIRSLAQIVSAEKP